MNTVVTFRGQSQDETLMEQPGEVSWKTLQDTRRGCLYPTFMLRGSQRLSGLQRLREPAPEREKDRLERMRLEINKEAMLAAMGVILENEEKRIRDEEDLAEGEKKVAGGVGTAGATGIPHWPTFF